MLSLISCRVAKPGFTEDGGSRDNKKKKLFFKAVNPNFTEIRGTGERKDWEVLGFYASRRSHTIRIPPGGHATKEA